MSIDFYLVRHAVKEKNVGDVSITAEGLEQAHATASHMKQMRITSIFSSPLNRAKQTAQVIGNATSLQIIEDTRLRERANWGDLPGQTFQEFVEMWDRCTKERDFLPPIGDSARMAGQRLSSFLLDISVQYRLENTVIVTHGGLITDFLLNEFSQEELNTKHPNFTIEQSNLVSECSITKIRLDSEGFKFVDFASIAHLH
ncbi:histidine phosphatase family protein [Paenibacillus qinlingensis]|uniref:Broad specificity phosphatase PhoE n=1 Tax=Paenibacillus qinlingensis TaxID=1837343 RepID=A0ABU1NYQ3_9BACL|nr:histidine phosphatase family protein [Paenibacillus qinlingensis]MDR6552605.1 broad specificity phosphatase PhoE [Paenibacillus qinlingensis]